MPVPHTEAGQAYRESIQEKLTHARRLEEVTTVGGRMSQRTVYDSAKLHSALGELCDWLWDLDATVAHLQEEAR